MTIPSVTIVTPTFDKPKLFAECARAVLVQSFADWTWWIVFNFDPEDVDGPIAYAEHSHIWWEDPRVMPIYFPVGSDVRAKHHVPAKIVNWLYPKVTTPYIYFLADDDLIDPDGLKALVDHAYRDYSEDHLGPIVDSLDAVYGRCEVTSEQPDGSFAHVGWLHPGAGELPAEGSWDIGLDTGISPDCLIDGGQVLHSKALWDRAIADGWQLDSSPAEEHAAHNDGTLLNRLAEFARFHYVPHRIVTHRRTHQSRWHKPLETP